MTTASHPYNERAGVLELNDSDVLQAGIVKTGAQSLTVELFHGSLKGQTATVVKGVPCNIWL